MKQHPFALFIIILSLFSFSCHVANSETDQPVIIPLTPYIGRLVTVSAFVNNEPVRLLLDTGGGETVISPEVAKKIHRDPTGRTIRFRMSGEQVIFQQCRDVPLVIGGVPFHHGEMGVWDIQSVLPENVPPVDGILSLKTFRDQPFTLDLSSRSLILETPKSLADRVQRMKRLESRIATGPDGSELDVFLLGTLKREGWFLLDSGNLDGVIVSEEYADGEPVDSEHASGVHEGELQLAGLPSHGVRYRVKNIIYDGALSEAFMRDYIYSFDLSANAIWACRCKRVRTDNAKEEIH